VAKEYILHKKQSAALRLILRIGVAIAGYLGGKRSGKTITGAHFIIYMIQQRPHELGAICSPTSHHLTHTVLLEFKNVLTSYGIIQGKHYVVNVNPKDRFGYETKFPTDHHGVYSFWNGAQIQTFSTDSFFMGAEFVYISCDEIQQLTKATLDEIQLRMSGSHEPKTFYTFTPPKNNPDIEALVYGEDDNEPGTGTLKLVVGTTYDNEKNLPPNYIKEKEDTLDPLNFERDIMCRRVRMLGHPWLYSFDRNKHVSEEAVYNPYEMVYASLDFNNNPFVCLLSHRGVRNGKRYIHYFDHVELTPTMVVGKTYIEAMVEQIHQKTNYQYENNLYQVTGDATGSSQSILMRVGQNILTELQVHMNISSAQMHFNRSNPFNVDARDLMNAILANSHKPEKIEVLINPKNKGQIRDCERVQSKPDGKMVKDSRAVEEQRADWLDAMKYDMNTFNGDFLREVQSVA
jgi:hypothetical protein